MSNNLSILSNIKIVLVQTFHPGNIGSAARAMKTMGLNNLWLVNPVDFPHADAVAMASNASNILEKATIVETLEQAISDCTTVVGTSARDRTLNIEPLSPESCAQTLLQNCETENVALVFGRERMGLHNHEINQCHFHVNIPANPEYPVLNIASAIQVLCYEIFKNAHTPQASNYRKLPSQEELEYLFTHLEETLDHVGFLRKNHKGLSMERIKRFFVRARPDQKEVKILRGILSGIQNLKKND